MLVGRDAELRTATRAVAGLSGGQPFVIGIVGDDGSGRTSLLNTAAEIARSEGSLVLAARGTGAELAPAYGGLLSLLRPLERRFDELAGAENAEVLRCAMALRSRPADSLDVGIGVLRLMTTLAEERPLVVAVDDADGLDPATVDALAFAFGRLGVDAVGALICLPPGRQAVWEPVTTQRIVLGPLGADELAALVMANVACEPEPAQACAIWADGNPLLAIELARSLSDDERKGRRPLPTLPRPTVRAVERMQAQLDALGEGARRALVVVAADRTGRASVIVGALTALGEAPGGLDEADEAGVISIDLDSVSFRHPLLRPLCYHLVAARSRRAAHRALAGALTEPADAAERAWQLVASCAGPDDDVAAVLDLVADDARRRGALVEAATTLERAAALSVDPAGRRERRRRAAVAFLDSYAFDDALRLLDLDDSEGALLAVEAVERRDGPAVALIRFDSTGAGDTAVRADLLVACGRTADALAAVEGAHPGSLMDSVRAAIEPALPLPPEPSGSTAIDRRARRRWLGAAADRGVSTAHPRTVDELVAAARAAAVRGAPADATSFLERARAAVPPGAERVAAEVDAITERLEATASSSDNSLGALTKAERRVAESVAAGRTNREVAEHLFVSVKTVDFHLQSIYRKLALRSRTELAVLMAGKGVPA
jgi:DNA-binding CsgD family transcriptional regulator